MKNSSDRRENGGHFWGVLASRRLPNTDPRARRKLEALSAKGVEFPPGIMSAQLRDSKLESDHEEVYM